MKILTADGPKQAREIAGQLIPFRAPHHTTSRAGIAEELRLSVGGVLYLDECAEFKRECLSYLRCAVENHVAQGHPMPLAIVLDTKNHLFQETYRSEGERAAAGRYVKRIAKLVELFGLAASGTHSLVSL